MSMTYNERYIGATLANGDRSTGHILEEGGHRWFICVDAAGNEYETEEQPRIRIDLTDASKVEHWVLVRAS